MQIVKKKNSRKAISPVLATVILIAITLIAAIAVAGFVFGLFGSFTSSATVQAILPSLTHTAGPVGTVSFQNTGTSNTNANSMTLTYGGVTCTPGITNAPVQLTAGITTTLAVTAGTCGLPTAGESFSGLLYMSNGGQVAFTGQFS